MLNFTPFWICLCLSWSCTSIYCASSSTGIDPIAFTLKVKKLKYVNWWFTWEPAKMSYGVLSNRVVHWALWLIFFNWLRDLGLNSKSNFDFEVEMYKEKWVFLINKPNNSPFQVITSAKMKKIKLFYCNCSKIFSTGYLDNPSQFKFIP